MRQSQTGRRAHDPAWQTQTFSRKHAACGNGSMRAQRDNRRRYAPDKPHALPNAGHERASQLPAGVRPRAPKRRSPHRRHQPQIEIPIAIVPSPRGFLLRGLSYASRRPKLFTGADRQLLGFTSRKRTHNLPMPWIVIGPEPTLTPLNVNFDAGCMVWYCNQQSLGRYSRRRDLLCAGVLAGSSRSSS